MVEDHQAGALVADSVVAPVVVAEPRAAVVGVVVVVVAEAAEGSRHVAAAVESEEVELVAAEVV